MTKKEPYRPILRTQADVATFWTEICRPLGWARHDLWFVMVDAERRPLPLVQDVRDRPVEVDPEMVRGLVDVWRHVRDDLVPDGSFAVLLCRPGSEVVQPTDRQWASAIASEAAAAGVPLEMIHVASDEAIRPLALDDAA
jgi:hypothetical protein